MSQLQRRVEEAYREVPRADRLILLAAMILGGVVVIAYALIINPNPLLGDQAEYHQQGQFFSTGNPWWSTVVTGVPHPTAWKAPVYPAWVGFWYSVTGANPTYVTLVQGFVLAPLTVFLTWLLASRWFGLRVAGLSAVLIAIFPLSWEFFGLLYSEALAIPMTLFVILLAFRPDPPTRLLAAGTGAFVGLLMLVRPTSAFLFGGILVAWILAAGFKRGLGSTAIAVGCAILVIAPWTVRNAVEMNAFIPISLQDGATYGTFNDEAANDPEYPYAWRADPGNLSAELELDPPSSEAEFRSQLQGRARDYVIDHPESVPQAFFWNGLTRFWDVRQPKRPLAETDFDGRSRAVTTAGLVAYYVLLPLALFSLWRLRERKEIVLPILALALSASLVFTVQAGTRYRAPLEPLVVILAASNIVLWRRPEAMPDEPAAP